MSPCLQDLPDHRHIYYSRRLRDLSVRSPYTLSTFLRVLEVKCRKSLEDAGHFKKQNLAEGNEERRWHGCVINLLYLCEDQSHGFAGRNEHAYSATQAIPSYVRIQPVHYVE